MAILPNAGRRCVQAARQTSRLLCAASTAVATKHTRCGAQQEEGVVHHWQAAGQHAMLVCSRVVPGPEGGAACVVCRTSRGGGRWGRSREATCCVWTGCRETPLPAPADAGGCGQGVNTAHVRRAAMHPVPPATTAPPAPHAHHVMSAAVVVWRSAQGCGPSRHRGAASAAHQQPHPPHRRLRLSYQKLWGSGGRLGCALHATAVVACCCLEARQ